MEFDAFKNMSVWELIKFLEKETKMNARKIKENSFIVVRNLNERKHAEAQKYQKLNQELVLKNDEYIKLHNALLAFFMGRKGLLEPAPEPYKSLELPLAVESKIQLDFDAFFKRTISNELSFDASHPFFCSEDFRQKLLTHYISLEDYEKCDMITKNDSCQ